jgi:hypothetical protein
MRRLMPPRSEGAFTREPPRARLDDRLTNLFSCDILPVMRDMGYMAKNTKRWYLRALVAGLCVLSLLFVFVGCDEIAEEKEDKDVRVTLEAGPYMEVNYSATTGHATFLNAGHLVLSPSDFTVTPGATIVNVEVRNVTAWVYLTFAAIGRYDSKTHVVSISETSGTIKGPASVKVYQKLR